MTAERLKKTAQTAEAKVAELAAEVAYLEKCRVHGWTPAGPNPSHKQNGGVAAGVVAAATDARAASAAEARAATAAAAAAVASIGSGGSFLDHQKERLMSAAAGASHSMAPPVPMARPLQSEHSAAAAALVASAQETVQAQARAAATAAATAAAQAAAQASISSRSRDPLGSQGASPSSGDASASGRRSGRLKPKVITFEDGWSFADDEPVTHPLGASADPQHVDGPYTDWRDKEAHARQMSILRMQQQFDVVEAHALAEAEAAVAAEAAQHARAREAQRSAAEPTALAMPASPAEVLLTNGYFLRVALDANEGAPVQEDRHADGKVERAFRSGRLQILYPTGTRKEVLPNGVQTVIFSNGDVKQTGVDKRVVYYYAEAATTHVSEPNGTQLYHFPNGQVERHFSDGLKEIKFADGTLKVVLPSGEVQSLTDMPFAPTGKLPKMMQGLSPQSALPYRR